MFCSIINQKEVARNFNSKILITTFLPVLIFTSGFLCTEFLLPKKGLARKCPDLFLEHEAFLLTLQDNAHLLVVKLCPSLQLLNVLTPRPKLLYNKKGYQKVPFVQRKLINHNGCGPFFLFKNQLS
jgi:hypothetical protein